MTSTLIVNARLVNEGREYEADLRIEGERIALIGDALAAKPGETVVDADGPVVLVAHSLGCILTAWWAAHSPNAHRVQGALLVAPGDVERPDLAAQIHGWAPIARQPLPFPSVLVGSRNDPYCSYERAEGLGEAWGARFVDGGARGHINAESGLADWPEGHHLLHTLLKD